MAGFFVIMLPPNQQPLLKPGLAEYSLHLVCEFAPPNWSLQPTAPQCVVTFPSDSLAAGTAPGTRCAQNQRQHTARQSRFLLAPASVFSAAPSGAAAELGR